VCIPLDVVEVVVEMVDAAEEIVEHLDEGYKEVGYDSSDPFEVDLFEMVQEALKAIAKYDEVAKCKNS